MTNNAFLAIVISTILTAACGDSGDNDPALLDDPNASTTEGPTTPATDSNPFSPLEPDGGSEAAADETTDPSPMTPLEPDNESEAPVDGASDSNADQTSAPESDAEQEAPADGTSDVETDLEVRDSFDLNVRPEAIDTIEFVSGLFEFYSRPGFEGPALSAERPYYEQRETSTPFSREPFVPGTTESVLIDIDTSGTGTYSNVSTYEDSDTRQLDSRIATRTHDGTSVTWMGTYTYTDSSSLRRESYDFTTETRAVGERTFLQSGEIKRVGSPNTTSDQRPIDITYELTTGGPITGLRECDPLAGTIVYDSGFTARTGPSDFTFVETETKIEKLEGERYWHVRETTTSEGLLRDEYLIVSIGLGPFCDFPEL